MHCFICNFAVAMRLTQKSESMLELIRSGKPMTTSDKLNLIVLLSIPSILAQITSVVMFFIDQAMVGHLGTNASAAVGLVETTTWLYGSMTGAASMHGLMATMVLTLILTLSAVCIAQPLPYWLGGKADIAGDASAYFLIFSLAGPFFQLAGICAAMLKCSGNMVIPSVVSILECVLDVVFNYFFIYQLHLGVKGAAMGTALSILIGAAILVWFAVFRSDILSLRRKDERFRLEWSYLRNALKIGTPMAAQSVLMSGAQIVSTLIVAPLGNVAIAANTLAITAESLCYMPGYGIGEAATTLVGQSIGAGRTSLCRSFAWMTVGSGMLIMALMGAVMFWLAPEMMGLMTPVDEVRMLGAQCLRIEAFAEPMFAASIVAFSVCVGAGDTFKPAMMNLACIWFVRLSLAYWLAADYGLRGVWIAMAIELCLRGLLLLGRLWRGHWMTTLTQQSAQ